jgi:hypothetical protein
MKETATIARYKTCSEIKKPQRQQEHQQEHDHQHPPFPLSSCVSLSLVRRLAFQSGSRLVEIARARSRPHELGVASLLPWAGRIRDRSVAGTAGMHQPASGQSLGDLAGAQPSLPTLTPTTALMLKPSATTPQQAITLYGPDMPEREYR